MFRNACRIEIIIGYKKHSTPEPDFKSLDLVQKLSYKIFNLEFGIINFVCSQNFLN